MRLCVLQFYYYPVSCNTGRDCAGLVKMAVEFDATLSQRLNMQHFPFDRQILQLGFFVRTGNRGGWAVSDEAAPWVDTGYDTDVRVQPAACLLACPRACASATFLGPFISFL